MAKWVSVYQDWDGQYASFVLDADDYDDADHQIHELSGSGAVVLCMELDEFKAIAKAVLKEGK